MHKMRRKEDGMIIVEATFVFPIAFLIIFLMIVLGNAYYQKSRVEAAVSEMAFYGASQCSDPLLKYIQDNKKVPDYGLEYEIEPYRYIVGNMTNIENDVKRQLTTKLSNMNTGLFSGMKPQTTDSNVRVSFNNWYVYSTFSVEVDYKIKLPVKLLGMADYFSIDYSSYYTVPVSDTPEFIRNVNMVEDWVESTEKGSAAIEKTTEFMSEISKYIN